MSKTNLYLAGGFVALLVIASGYLLLSRPSNNPLSKNNNSQAPTQAPITSQNADESLSQTETSVDTQLNQADQDITAAQQTSTSTTSQEDLSSINNL